MSMNMNISTEIKSDLKHDDTEPKEINVTNPAPGTRYKLVTKRKSDEVQVPRQHCASAFVYAVSSFVFWAVLANHFTGGGLVQIISSFKG